MAHEMVKKAGSIDPKALTATMSGIDYKGVCGELKSNADHDLMTTMYMVDSGGGTGQKKLLQTFTNS